MKKPWIAIKFGPSVAKDRGTLGCCLATVISYSTHHHIGRAILHGVFGWLYVAYYYLTGSWQGPIS
jgi:hypothetical protein